MRRLRTISVTAAITVMALAFLGGCGQSASTDETSSASAVPASLPAGPATSASGMNLAQIQAGDYSSLLGTWKEVAWAVNDYDMNNPGVHWHAGSASSVDTISVSSDRIVFDGMGVAMQGNTLTDNNGAHALLLQSRGGSLDASLADQSVAINWGVYFYPIGATEVSSDFQPDNGVTIDNTKNLIVIWTSNMGATTVFAQQ